MGVYRNIFGKKSLRVRNLASKCFSFQQKENMVKFFYYMYAECLTDIKQIMKRIRTDMVIFKMLGVKKCLSTELMELEGLVTSLIE